MENIVLPKEEDYQRLYDGKATELVVLRNAHRMTVAITNYGGRIAALFVPDSAGSFRDVVVGFDSVDGFKQSSEPYYGALIGRYGNRIARGHFSLNGKAYQLPTNNGPNCLHGGIKGFQDVVWDIVSSDETEVILHYLSKDGEEGFPGNLDVRMNYRLNDANDLHMIYESTTDQSTGRRIPS